MKRVMLVMVSLSQTWDLDWLSVVSMWIWAMPAAEMKSSRVNVRGDMGSLVSSGHVPGMGGMVL